MLVFLISTLRRNQFDNVHGMSVKTWIFNQFPSSSTLRSCAVEAVARRCRVVLIRRRPSSSVLFRPRSLASFLPFRIVVVSRCCCSSLSSSYSVLSRLLVLLLEGMQPPKTHSGVQKVSPEPCGHVPCDSEVGGTKQSSSVIGTRRQLDKTFLN